MKKLYSFFFLKHDIGFMRFCYAMLCYADSLCCFTNGLPVVDAVHSVHSGSVALRLFKRVEPV